MNQAGCNLLPQIHGSPSLLCFTFHAHLYHHPTVSECVGVRCLVLPCLQECLSIFPSPYSFREKQTASNPYAYQETTPNRPQFQQVCFLLIHQNFQHVFDLRNPLYTFTLCSRRHRVSPTLVMQETAKSRKILHGQ